MGQTALQAMRRSPQYPINRAAVATSHLLRRVSNGFISRPDACFLKGLEDESLAVDHYRKLIEWLCKFK